MTVTHEQAAAYAGHAVATGTFIAVFFEYLPKVVALIGSLLGVLWYIIMISESETGKRWMHKVKKRFTRKHHE